MVCATAHARRPGTYSLGHRAVVATNRCRRRPEPRHHDRVGHELEARRRRGMPVDAAALAHHFGRAAPFGNAAPAFTYTLGAAAEAEALLSFDVAAGRFEQALAMLAIDPGLGGGLDVKLALGDAPVAAGDVSRARRTFERGSGGSGMDRRPAGARPGVARLQRRHDSHGGGD